MQGVIIMCVILVKEKGIELPTKKVLKCCWERNPDGAGFMFNDYDKVVIMKGFMTFEEFYLRLQTANEFYHLKEKGLVIHFRIATSGLKDKGNCHPYPISNDNLDLRKSFITTELGIAHNGIIRSYNGKDKILNDTQLFIKNDLFELNSLDKKFYKNVIFQSMIERLIDGSRLVFLNKKGEIIKLGKWFHNGNYYFSNLNHVSKNTLNINKKPILFDNDLKYFDEENNNFVINDEVVDKDYFDLFIDTLDRLENGDSVYSEDYFQEYNSFNGKYYLNQDEKMIYELIRNNELMFVDYYKSKEEYYKLKL
jgi:predicted glutamine amidotransferase